MRFQIYRYDPESDKDPWMQEYELEARPGMMVRDALLRIKEQDETLVFRHSCGGKAYAVPMR